MEISDYEYSDDCVDEENEGKDEESLYRRVVNLLRGYVLFTSPEISYLTCCRLLIFITVAVGVVFRRNYYIFMLYISLPTYYIFGMSIVSRVKFL